MERENVVIKKEKESKEEKRKRIMEKVPEHIYNLAAIVKNNVQIRYYTAIAIINYLSQKKEIAEVKDKSKGQGNYVAFLWDKFIVKNNGLAREYRYTEDFFIKAVVGSFSSFAASAQKVIDTFLEVENINYKQNE